MHKRRALIMAMSILSTGVPGLSAQAEAGVAITLGSAPPPLRVERVPPPRRGYVWSPGYWAWNGRHYVWVAGYWVHVRHHQYYAPGHWVEGPGGWQFVPPAWASGEGPP
jgi:hypothetical protein